MNFPFESEIVLENPAVRLQPLTLSDVENLLFVATSDRDLLRFSPFPIYNKELLTQYITRAIDGRRNKLRYSFSVFDKNKNSFAGSTSFMNISDGDDRLEIGSTWYGKPFQRTGLNRNCKYLLLEYAFDQLHAERVEFKTDERNIPSQLAIQKIGGQYEGLLRRHTLMYDGYRRNTVCYSILKSEWGELKGGFMDRKE